MTRERRRHPRFGRQAPLILIERAVRDEGEGAILRDVSLGGLAFETNLDFQPGDSFDFALYVPTRGWVDGTGKICWTKAEGGAKLCGASIEVREWDQSQLLERWLHPAGRGILRFFFPDKGADPSSDPE